MFDIFSQIGGGVFSQRLGHFLREGIKPSPAVDGVYPRPTNSEQDTKQMHRRCEGGDKPHPYGGGVLQASKNQEVSL